MHEISSNDSFKWALPCFCQHWVLSASEQPIHLVLQSPHGVSSSRSSYSYYTSFSRKLRKTPAFSQCIIYSPPILKCNLFSTRIVFLFIRLTYINGCRFRVDVRYSTLQHIPLCNLFNINFLPLISSTSSTIKPHFVFFIDCRHSLFPASGFGLLGLFCSHLILLIQ